MNLESIIEYCSLKDFSEQSYPFDEDTLVFKVKQKIFALINMLPPYSISLKCDPEYAVELRERYDYIIPGYHLNKKHWNTLNLDKCPKEKSLELIDLSYKLVTSKFKKSTKKE